MPANSGDAIGLLLQEWTNINPITGAIHNLARFAHIANDELSSLRKCITLGCFHGILLHTNDDLRACKVFGCRCNRYKR
jgi:hypothetical protein